MIFGLVAAAPEVVFVQVHFVSEYVAVGEEPAISVVPILGSTASSCFTPVIGVPVGAHVHNFESYGVAPGSVVSIPSIVGFCS